MNHYPVIVIGVGAMGSAACYQLAKRGVRVLGIEQFDIPHGLGSHHGYSRMIRLAYFEHADYVALLRRAYELYDELEADSGQKVLHVAGGLYLGRPDSELVTGSLAAARQYDLPHEVIDRGELSRRFPQFRVPGDTIAFYETKAGFLIPEKVIAAQAEQAMRRGAELHGRETVTSWQADDKRVTVTTNRATYTADHVIFTGGAWSGRLLADLGVELTVTRQTMGWFWPRDPDAFALGAFPCWALDLEEKGNYRGVHYGFPMMPDNPGFKLARHFPDEPCEPETVDRSARDADIADLRHALEAHLPGALGPLLSLRVCLYTNTPDGHFIIDRHPRHERVTLACGFSGHGFKFTSVIGEVLADLATTGESRNPIGFLGLKRFA